MAFCRSIPVFLVALAAAGAHAQSYATGFESPFVLGNVVGQQGWRGGEPLLGFSGPTPDAKIVASGTGQALSVGPNPSGPSYETWVATPDLGFYTGQTATSMDLRIDGSGTGYTVNLLATADTILTARVIFAGNGDVLVRPERREGANLVDTGVNWTAGQAFNLSILTDSAANRLTVQIDGTTVYSDLASDRFSPAFDTVLFGSDNAPGTGGSMLVDRLSVQVVPEPASMAALGLGAVAMLRRRKKA